ncbi:MFS transporter [Rhodopirellula sp. JC740]|uniref:MFS transporter n=1 Tax=Rhodopirellula halodulae TaxID=2894198 RepID=A0ABS8NPQ5_9BACT|nr:MFS transporter [Rhodopirellula sp. JC740]MCC9644947.1 MFS transporter [Rhodopirellula sp. JC740]
MPYSKRRNTRRAAIGSLFFVAGLFAGTIVAVPKLHRAWLAEQTPVEMTCGELLQNGIGEASVVRLTDATVAEPPEEMQFAMLEPAPNAMQAMPVGSGMGAWMSGDKVSMAKKTLADALRHPRAQTMLDEMVRGEVMPRHLGGTNMPQPLKLSPGREVAAKAVDEVRSTGSLTVFVSEDPTIQWIADGANLLGVELPESFVDLAKLDCYSLHPVSLTESKQNAAIWAAGSALTLTLGWLLCSSAGWGIWILFCPIAAVAGVFGLPMRSGRGNKVTWTLAFFAGGFCLAAAFVLTVFLGGLGSTPSSWAFQAAGFVSLCAGLALWLGILGSMKTKRNMAMSISSLDNLVVADPKRSRSSKKAAKKSSGDVDASKFASDGVRQDKLQETLSKNASYSRRYLDPRLSVPANLTIRDEANENVIVWQNNAFEEPLAIEIGRGDAACSATVQVGCQNLVLAMTDELDGNIRLRLISFLDNGHCLISVDGSYPELTENLSNEFATISVFESADAKKLLAKHLEVSADAAERQHSGLIRLDSNEWRDIVLLSERAVKSVLHDEGLQKWEIHDATYGRFAFPCRPIQSMQTV